MDILSRRLLITATFGIVFGCFAFYQAEALTRMKTKKSLIDPNLSKTALVLVADGSEDIEVATVVDVLRRADIEVIIASTSETLDVVLSKGLQVTADKMINDIGTTSDAVIIPGGYNGVKAIRSNEKAMGVLRNHVDEKKLVALICAGPLALMDLENGKRPSKITSWPSFEEKFVKNDFEWEDKRVVEDGNFLTSQGPGTAMEFALKIVKILTNDDDLVDKLKKGLLL